MRIKILVLIVTLVFSGASFAQMSLSGPSENYTGSYQIDINVNCGGLGGTYYLYENNALVQQQGCFYNNADTFTANGKSNGTYTYRLDFCDVWLCISEFGGEPTHTVNVDVNGAPTPPTQPPPKPVVSLFLQTIWNGNTVDYYELSWSATHADVCSLELKYFRQYNLPYGVTYYGLSTTINDIQINQGFYDTTLITAEVKCTGEGGSGSNDAAMPFGF